MFNITTSFTNCIEIISEFIIATVTLLSAIAYFHHSYRIEASFDIKYNHFTKIMITFINNSTRINSLIEFMGVIPSKQDIIYTYSHGRKRIKKVKPTAISYSKKDSNYNESYVKYFRQLKTMRPHTSLNRIVIPLTDIIKIIKINRYWKNTFIENLINDNSIKFIVLFKDSKRKPIYKAININPNQNKEKKSTYNFILSKLLNHNEIKQINIKHKKIINNKNDIIGFTITELNMLP